MAQKQKRKRRQQQEKLNESLGNTSADFSANEAGIIPDHQQKRIVEQHRSKAIEAITKLALSFLSLFAIGFFFWAITPSTRYEYPFSLVIVSTVWVVLSLYGGFHYGLHRLRRQLEQADIKTIEGNVEKWVSTIHIDGTTLQLPKTALSYITEGETYRVHYLPQEKKVLSMEIIDVDDNLLSEVAYQANTQSNTAQESSHRREDSTHGSHATERR